MSRMSIASSNDLSRVFPSTKTFNGLAWWPPRSSGEYFKAPWRERSWSELPRPVARISDLVVQMEASPPPYDWRQRSREAIQVDSPFKGGDPSSNERLGGFHIKLRIINSFEHLGKDARPPIGLMVKEGLSKISWRFLNKTQTTIFPQDRSSLTLETNSAVNTNQRLETFH